MLCRASSCRLKVFLKPITKGEILVYLLRFIKMGEASFFRVSELASPDAAVNRFFVRQCGQVPRRRISHDWTYSTLPFHHSPCGRGNMFSHTTFTSHSRTDILKRRDSDVLLA